MADTIGVGLVGYKFMGKSHSNAYRQVASFFPDLKLQPEMKALCGRDEAGVKAAAAQMGWQGYETDWHKLVARQDIGLVDVSTPGDSHAAIAIEAAKNGKHIFCEKPLANTLAEARQMQAAVEQAGVVGMVNFNYRRVPAVQLAKRLIDDGRIGKVYHWRAVYLQDWIMDPNFPLVWRLDKNQAGSGTLGDLGAHIIDLARMLIGDIAEVSGLTETFIKQRPLLAGTTGGLGAAGSQEHGRGHGRRCGAVPGALPERCSRLVRGHAVCEWSSQLQLVRDQWLEGQHCVQPGAHERAECAAERRAKPMWPAFAMCS